MTSSQIARATSGPGLRALRHYNRDRTRPGVEPICRPDDPLALGISGPSIRRRRLDEDIPSGRRCCVGPDDLEQSSVCTGLARPAPGQCCDDVSGWDGRGSWIRTNDLQYPKLPRYQAALYPDISERPRGYTLQPAPARRRCGAYCCDAGGGFRPEIAQKRKASGRRTADGRPGRRAGCRTSARCRQSPRGRPWRAPATE